MDSELLTRTGEAHLQVVDGVEGRDSKPETMCFGGEGTHAGGNIQDCFAAQAFSVGIEQPS